MRNVFRRSPHIDGPSEEEQRLEKDLKGLRQRREMKNEYLKLYKGIIDWSALLTLKALKWYAILAVVGAIGAVAFIYHDQIIDFLTPYATKLQNFQAGWLIPVVLISILSIPPLGGQEFVILLVGLVWGPWIGFAIATAGTIVGELLNWIIYKKCFPELREKETLLFIVLRDGGIWMCFATRMTYIPTHLTTTIYAVCGFPLFNFCVAMMASTPKQLATTYAGSVMGKKTVDQKDTIISWTVAGVSLAITIGVCVWMYMRMRKARLARMKTIQGKLPDLLYPGAAGITKA